MSKRGRLPGAVLKAALILASAAMAWAAFPMLSLWVLLIPALALLSGVVDSSSPGTGFGWAGLWALAFFLPHISWMQIATDGTWLAWFALAGAQAFFIGLWGASFSAMGNWGWARTAFGEAAGGALLWVTFEELRSRIPFGGFPWGKVAYPMVDSPLVALAPVGGEVLVSFVLVFAAILLRRAFGPHPRPTQPFVRLFALVTALALFILPLAITLPAGEQAGSVRAGLVQGNVERPMMETFSVPGKVTGNHVAATLEMMDQLGQMGKEAPQVVFWGENATDLDPRDDEMTQRLMEEASEAVGVPLVTGLMEYVGNESYNWIGVWYPGVGFGPDFYGKQHPVPWGEYIPFRTLTLWLATAAARISVDMVAVDNPGYLEVELNDGQSLPMAVGICFEVAYEPIIAQGVRMGGQMIYIPTNNAHFQDSPESLQQLQMGQFRAAQFQRSTIQVSTNGVSAVVRPDGSIYKITQMEEPASLVADLPLRTSITLSAKMGEFPAYLVMITGTLLAAGSLGAQTWRKKNTGGSAAA